MVVIDSIVFAWVQAIGGPETVFNILSLMFVYTVVYIFYKVST